MVLVTHDSEAAGVADRRYTLRDGRLAEQESQGQEPHRQEPQGQGSHGQEREVLEIRSAR